MNIQKNPVFADFIQSAVSGGLNNPYGLAALAATGQAESSFSPKTAAAAWSDPSESGQAGTAGGILSWRGPRLAALRSFAAAKGEQGNGSPQTQAEFFIQENPALTTALNKAQSLEEAQNAINKAWAFKGYQNPGGESARRLGYAKQFLTHFAGDDASSLTGYADPQVKAGNAGSAAIDNQMTGGIKPNMVQTVQYVPPPFSGQQGGFTPLLGNDLVSAQSDLHPAQVAPMQTPQRATQSTQGSDDDILKAFLPSGASDAPAAQPAAKESDDDFLKSFLPAQAPAAQVEVAKEKAPSKGLSDVTLGDIASGISGFGRSVASGVPIVGGLLNKADAATNALVAPLVNPMLSDGNQLKGDTWSERYANSLSQQNAMDSQFAEQHPIANTVGNIAGGMASVGGAMAASPKIAAALGAGGGGLATNMLTGAASGAAIGAADSGIRSNGDLGAIKSGAELGGAFGAAGPAVGKTIGWTGNKLLDAVSGTTPAARNVAGVLGDIQLTPTEAKNVLTRMGPSATLADVDPALTNEAGGLASMGGSPTSILKKAMAARAAGADDRVGQVVEQNLGARPDLTQAQESIAAKASADAGPFYQAAPTDPLDATPVLDAINKRLETANGSEKNVLNKFKSYLSDPTADLETQTKQAVTNSLNSIVDHIAATGVDDSGLDAARSILVRAQTGSIDKDAAQEALAHLQSSDPTAQALISGAADALNKVSPVKSDPQALLKVRQAMDDDIQKAPISETTGGKNAERSANGVRAELDKVLKSNEGIKAGDQAYSAQMQNARALQEGTEIFSPKTRIEDLQRSVDTKTPEQLDHMRTGALSSLWDALDNARNGDLTAIRSLLGKSTANRQKLEALFPKSSEVFDKISNEAAMRATEQRVAQNSATAERQAVQQKYAPKENNISGIAEATVGNAIAGGPGAAIGYLGRNALNAIRSQMGTNSRNALIEGTARGLSATGAEQQAFLAQLEKAMASARGNALISNGADIGTNLLFRSVADEMRRRLPAVNVPAVHQPLEITVTPRR